MMYGTETKSGIGGGLVMCLLSLNYNEVFQTVVCAAAGAIVSFGVSFILMKIKKGRNR